MPKTRARRWKAIVFTTVAAVVLGLGGYVVFERTKPFLIGSGCMARVYGQAIHLDSDQAAVAATIAGVGHHAGVPMAAVTVALATALQESHLHNIGYGDRDSVGVFQQRPSEGWGTPSQLRDPVYAATKFFAALVKVPRYTDMPVAKAAQAVQHSADGTAYARYGDAATTLSAAFTGDRARAVWCWYPPYPASKRARLAAAEAELQRTFGPLVADERAAGGPAGTAHGVRRAATGASGTAGDAGLAAHETVRLQSARSSQGAHSGSSGEDAAGGAASSVDGARRILSAASAPTAASAPSTTPAGAPAETTPAGATATAHGALASTAGNTLASTAGGAASRTAGNAPARAADSTASGAASGTASGAARMSARTAAAVPAPRAQTGWAIASWAVTHARTYGIREVLYAGYAWRASNGQDGWRSDAKASADRVELG